MFKKLWLPIGIVLLLFLFIVNISFGTVKIPFRHVVEILFGDTEIKQSWSYIVLNYRLPKAITAVLIGSSLAVSGLLMQTLFRNPMAESYVLGISSGASLAIAIVIMGSVFLPTFLLPFLVSPYGLVVISVLGSFLLMMLVLAVSNKVKNSMTILIVGLMFGSFSGAIISILTYWSNADQLKRFSLWMLGSLGNLSWEMILIFAICVLIGLISSFALSRTLDALLLGDTYAQSLGINVKQSRNKIILVTSLLAGAGVAFVGPIAFIGLAVPHIARLLLQSSRHIELIVMCIIVGAIIMLLCDVLSQVNGEGGLMPINAITALFGAPIVVYLLLKKRF